MSVMAWLRSMYRPKPLLAACFALIAGGTLVAPALERAGLLADGPAHDLSRALLMVGMVVALLTVDADMRLKGKEEDDA